MRRTLVTVAVLALTALTLGPVASAGAAQPAPSPAVGVATEVPLTSAVAHATFVNQDGQTVSLGALKGKTILVTPYLTLCGDTCPFTTGNLLQVESTLKADHITNVEIVAMDIDPYRDSLARVQAYAKLIGADFQLWTETGPTTTPHLSAAELQKKNPIGTGDINATLSLMEKFFSWQVHVVPQSSPPPRDWMAPHEKLTYDIAHTNGFEIISPTQVVRFASADLPTFTGKLSKVLSTFMGYTSNIYKNPVYKGGWTPADALAALSYVDNVKY